jgi:hypothetical protein
MGGVLVAELLLVLLEAFPFAAAVLNVLGDVVARSERFLARLGGGVREPPLIEVELGAEGHRLLFVRQGLGPLAFDTFVKRHGCFTRRESEVLEGLSSRTIAARLDLGLRTVESHIAHFLQKSECESPG